MPRVIEVDIEERFDVGDLVETLETERFDPRDEACFASFGPALKKLTNNRGFLVDIVVAELKRHCRNQSEVNAYGPQVMMLHRSRDFYIRANFWPAESDAVLQDNGPGAFFYHVPHDHNFSFLTAGYSGPGYWSDYYEYRYDDVNGVPGEAVDLRFVGRSRLAEGQVMLYRAHHDVHAQLPADSLSVSLNVVEQCASIPFRDQYRFDTAAGTIAEVLTLSAVEPLLALCAHVGGANARDLVSDFAAAHPSDRVRFSAVKALASMETGADARLAVFAAGTRSGNTVVARRSAQAIAEIEYGRTWSERRAG